MDHPVTYVAHATKFLDRLIQEDGDYLFVGLVFICFSVVVWILVRRRKRSAHEVPVVILPLGHSPKIEPDPEPLLFEEPPDS